MFLKKCNFLLLLFVMIFIFSLTAVSANAQTENLTDLSPAFQAQLIEQGSEAGLYITVSNLPQASTKITMEYSFNGVDYYTTAGNELEWDFDLSQCQITNNTVKIFAGSLAHHPLHGYATGAVENLYLKASIYENSQIPSHELPPFLLSHKKTYEIPAVPPDFSLDVEYNWNSYGLYGNFSDFPPNVSSVQAFYSWDNINYEKLSNYSLENLANPNPEKLKTLLHANIGVQEMEPLTSFLNGSQNSFYVRLTINTQNGNSYFSKPSRFSRIENSLLPESLTPRIALGFDVEEIEIKYEDDSRIYSSWGEYNITVSENTSMQEIQSLLPSTLPVKITLWNKYTKQKHTYTELDCPVQWNTLSNLTLTAGETLKIENAAQPLTVAAGTQIKTPLGNYTLTTPLTFKSKFDSDKITLYINTTAQNTQPQLTLRGCDRTLLAENDGPYRITEGDVMSFVDNTTPLAVLFTQKPTGATSLPAYAVIDGQPVFIKDLLTDKNVDYNQSRKEYGYVTLFDSNQSVYEKYLKGEINDISIQVQIIGGVFDGQVATASWPANYTLPLPLPEKGKGSAGSENNAGSDFEEIEDDNQGQRPWLPPQVDNSVSAGTAATPPPQSTALPASKAPSSTPAQSQPVSTSQPQSSQPPSSQSQSTPPQSMPVQGKAENKSAPKLSTAAKIGIAAAATAVVAIGFVLFCGTNALAQAAAFIEKIIKLIHK